MNNTHFYQHLEILFWKIAIAMIHEWRRYKRPSIAVMAIFLGLVVCASFGFSIFYMRGFDIVLNRINESRVQNEEKAETIHPMQHNTLLIFVDGIDENPPQLVGLWMAVTQVENFKTFLLPIYPSIKDRAIYLDEDIAGSFGMTAWGDPQDDFVAVLETTGIWWEAFLVLDKIAVEGMIDFLGENPSIRWFVSGGFWGSQFSPELNDPWIALMAQVDIMNAMCERSTTVFQLMQSDPGMEKEAAHFSTNLSSSQLSEAQTRLFDYGGSISCEFPTFSDAIAIKDGR